MKPAPFEYHAPRTLEEALELLARHGDDAKALAGGQSLIPAMNFRLAQPAVLVDLNGIEELFYLEGSEEGGLRIGTMTRLRQVERSPLVAERAPLVVETLPFIAHPQIRNRSTFGGSIAHADPAAELPAVALAMDARLHLRSHSGSRQLAVTEFNTGLFETALTPEELLVEVELPPPPARTGWAFTEISRRHGDFALVGIAARITLGSDGKCSTARLALLSVGEGPVLASRAAVGLEGQGYSEDLVRAAAATVAHQEIDPPGDIHASPKYRRHLAEVLTRRVLESAWQRAMIALGP
jgi:carbon-monoxide dehydrogenase medium subunit